MSALVRKRRRPRRSSAPSTESAIYAGADLSGFVTGRTGAFTASTAARRRLGTFRTAPEAMLAIIEAHSKVSPACGR